LLSVDVRAHTSMKQQTNPQQKSMIACVVGEGGVKESIQQRLCLVGARYQTKAATHRWSDDQDVYGQDCCQGGDATRMFHTGVVWKGLGFDQILAKFSTKMLPITVLCENEGAIATAENDMITTRTKHVDIADLYIKQAVQENFILMKKVHTKENLADLMTKPLARQKIQGMVSAIFSKRS
jgi:hypothetical protein